MKLTKEQFRNKFWVETEFSGFTPTYSETIHGYKMYRALELLVLEDGGKFYAFHK